MYGFSTQLKVPFDTAVAKVTAALKQEGFGVLTDIDVKATLKPSSISSGGLIAYSARVTPRSHTAREEADGTITVAFMDPETVLRLVGKPEVHALGKEVRVLLQRVCASLEA
jgi:hypothetical protein